VGRRPIRDRLPQSSRHDDGRKVGLARKKRGRSDFHTQRAKILLGTKWFVEKKSEQLRLKARTGDVGFQRRVLWYHYRRLPHVNESKTSKRELVNSDSKLVKRGRGKLRKKRTKRDRRSRNATVPASVLSQGNGFTAANRERLQRTAGTASMVDQDQVMRRSGFGGRGLPTRSNP